ncbi:MAG TPA: high-potential iron-sulfur protein [Dokdonella sp.]|uniref:high-potential iron-sulfur protein n=1 Tax=Dokdonella sp. TaxID=2291710 RepID=UPI002D7FFFEC|nr:high-potential iron-sulfur protein [Dokdonella sp.]HET9033977.1 high-potential iron-sulfur protein [Dokdonella sp.]
MMTSKTLSLPTTSRRQFLKVAVFGAGAAALSTVLIGKARAADLPHLTLDDATAKALGYVEDHTKVDAAKYPNHQSDQDCAACNFFQGGDNDEYAACTLFPGKAVHRNGWCSGYAPKPA